MAISLVGPDGREYEIDDPAGIIPLEAKGFRVSMPTAPQTLGESAQAVGNDALDTVEAGGTGFLRGVTAGLSDVAYAGLKRHDELPEEEAARHAAVESKKRLLEANPVATGVGEFAGMLASPIGEVGAGVKGAVGATTALGRIGASALAGGVEGALYGAGNTMSDAALGDHDLTGEKLIAGIGLGGALGLVGGGLVTGLAEGFKAVAPVVGRALSGAREPLQEFAENRWLKAGGAIASDIQKIPEGERPAVANVIREAMTPAGKLLPASLDDAAASVSAERESVAKQLMKEVGVGDAGGLLPKMDRDDALAALNKGFKENGDRMGAVLQQADQMGARPKFSGALRRFDDLEAGLNPAERDIISPDLARARKYILEMGNAPVGSPKNTFQAMNSLKSTLQEDINWADSGAKNNLKKKLVGIIKDELDSQFEVQMGPTLSAEFQQAKSAYGALKQAAKVMKGKNATGADAISALVENASLAAPNLGGKLSALDHASKLIRHGMDRQLGNRFISPSDYAVGIAGAISNPLGALAGLPAAIGHKILREKGPAVIAKLADHIAASPRLQIAARSFGNQLQAATPQLGQFAAPLTQALARSPAMALATHMTMAAAHPDYAAAAQSAGFLPETPEEATHAEAKGNALAAVAHTLDKQNTHIENGVAAILKGTRAAPETTVLGSQDFGAKRMRRDDASAHQQRIDEIRQLAANPQALIDRVAGNIGHMGELAPGVSSAMTRTAHAAVAYLAQQSQQPPKAGPLAADWTPTDAEIYKFSRQLETVQDPMSILKHAAAGTLTEDQMGALRAVYPLLGQQIADKMLERIVAEPRGVPYRAKLMVGLLTGTDPDGSMGQLAANQAAIQSASQKPSDKGAPTSSGKSPVTLAQRTAMPSQRSELSKE